MRKFWYIKSLFSVGGLLIGQFYLVVIDNICKSRKHKQNRKLLKSEHIQFWMDKWFGGEFGKVTASAVSNQVILLCQVKRGSFCLGIICLCCQEGEITIFPLNLKTQITRFDVAPLNESNNSCFGTFINHRKKMTNRIRKNLINRKNISQLFMSRRKPAWF